MADVRVTFKVRCDGGMASEIIPKAIVALEENGFLIDSASVVYGEKAVNEISDRQNTLDLKK